MRRCWERRPSSVTTRDDVSSDAQREERDESWDWRDEFDARRDEARSALDVISAKCVSAAARFLVSYRLTSNVRNEYDSASFLFVEDRRLSKKRARRRRALYACQRCSERERALSLRRAAKHLAIRSDARCCWSFALLLERPP